MSHRARPCPEAEGEAAQNDAPFREAVSYALFYIGFYIEDSVDGFLGQAFHETRSGLFRD